MLKKSVIALILISLISAFPAPNVSRAEDETRQTEAKQADTPPFEMATYVLAFLRRGPAWTAERTEESLKLSEGHMANINRLAEEGKLALAGPFLDAEKVGDLAGLFLFRTESIDTARAWSQSDPAVQAGRFTMEYHLWYGAKNISYK